MIKVEDFGLVGPAYVAPMTLQAVEECINWYVEVADIDSAKMAVALLGTPGLNSVLTQAFLTTVTTVTHQPGNDTSGPVIPQYRTGIENLNGPVRGLHVLPGGETALMVVGAAVLLVSGSNVPGVGLRMSAKQVGTLLTNQGPVSIADNGVTTGASPAVTHIVQVPEEPGQTVPNPPITVIDTPAVLGVGGYAVIVDGTAGYYYALDGVDRFAQFYATITVDTSTNTGTLTVVNADGTPADFPSGFVVTNGQTATITGLNYTIFPAGTVITAIDTTQNTITVSPAPDISNLTNPNDPVGPVQINIPVFGQITDPAFVQFGPSSRVDFFQGWLIFNQVGTRLFFTNAPTPYTITFNGLFYALADNGSDNLITLQISSSELWLLTENRAEVWYNSGGGGTGLFAWSRLSGVAPQIGCSAPFSLARMGTQLVWLARNEQGENMVMEQAQYTGIRISNHAVEHAISSYPEVSDAIGYTYEEDGHLFYVLTFPSADVTWVYDDTSSQKFGHPCWHKRASVDINGQFHRHRSNCYMNFLNTRIVGDFQNGCLHEMSRKYKSDLGFPIRSLRRTRHIWANTSRGRLFLSQLQLEFTPGVGTDTGQGRVPRAMLRWSSDGGFSWSREYWAGIGKTGQTRNRCVFRQLGYAWDRVFEISFTDPVERDLIGATLYAEPEIAAIDVG